MKRLMITKSLVMKIQNLVVNHESEPIKSDPVVYQYNDEPNRLTK